jgi:tight adherence protein C
MDDALSITLQIAVFAAVVGGVLAVVWRLEQGALIRRRMKDGPAAVQGAPDETLFKVARPANPLLSWVQARLPAARKDQPSRLARTLAEAGFPAPSATAWYALARIGSAVGLPLILLVSQKLSSAPITGLKLVVAALVLCGLGLVVPAMIVDLRAAGRRERLENQFPDALDLMVVCIEAGLGFDAAFVRVSQEIAASHRDIAFEFGRVSQELRAGRSRPDALRRMSERVNVDALRAFAALMIQTDSLGASVGQTLRTYSAEMRERRFLRGEEKAMRIPVLLTLPLVACILPVIITALLLPAGLDVAHNLLPALKRH